MQRYTYLTICLIIISHLGVLAQSGNVGIGISSPISKLHIRASQPAFTLESNLPLNISAGRETISRIIFRGQKNNNFRDAAYITAKQSGTWSANTLTFAPTSLQFFTQSFGSADGLASPRMVISNTGNVGVGVESPRVRFHISGGSPGTFTSSRTTTTLIESDTANYINLFHPEMYASGIHFGFPSDHFSGGLLYNDSNTPQGFQFRTNGNISRMVIDSEGLVGIGTTSPKQRLHIAKGSAGTFASSTNTTAVFESNTDNYISLMNPAAKSSGILFENPTNQNTAGIIYNDSIVRGLQIYANDKDPSIYIDNFANVGINDATPNAALSIKAKSNDIVVLKVKDTFGEEVLEARSDGTAGINGIHNNVSLSVQAKPTHTMAFFAVNFSGGSLFTVRNDGISAIGSAGEVQTKFLVENAEGYNEVLKVRNNSQSLIMQCSNDKTSDFFGQVTKPLGSFKIDHPLDPENKYLYHSFVESPDMMNIYNGNITTDAEGRATVDLPDYFEALNMEFRYQLTVIGSFAHAIIEEEVKENQFVIATDEPNVKVSWQVTGIRHDPYANEHRIPNSIDKAPEDKGTYLYPEVYGKPAFQSEGYSKRGRE